MEIKNGGVKRRSAPLESVEIVKGAPQKSFVVVTGESIPLAAKEKNVVITGVAGKRAITTNLYETYAEDLVDIKSFSEALLYFEKLSKEKGLSIYKLRKILASAKNLCRRREKENKIIDLITPRDVMHIIGESSNLMNYYVFSSIIHRLTHIDKNDLDYKEGRILNPLLSACIIGCVYNGIYSSDMSVLDNLTRRDIDLSNNTVVVRPNDAPVRIIEVEEWLAKSLVEMSFDVVQRKKHKYGVILTEIEGKYPDSCFKFHLKTSNSWDSITKKGHILMYERPVKSVTDFSFLNIFKSGIWHRIAEKLKMHDVDMSDVMRSSAPLDPVVKEIFLTEYERCGVYGRGDSRKIKEFISI